MYNFRINHLFLIGILSTISIPTLPAQVLANQGQCTFYDVRSNRSMTMPLATSLDFCAFNIRASSNRQSIAFGLWNGYTVAANRAGQVYVLGSRKWKYVGIIRERPLSDQCAEGNARACKKWGDNLDRLVKKYEECRRARIIVCW